MSVRDYLRLFIECNRHLTIISSFLKLPDTRCLADFSGNKGTLDFFLAPLTVNITCVSFGFMFSVMSFIADVRVCRWSL